MDTFRFTYRTSDTCLATRQLYSAQHTGERSHVDRRTIACGVIVILATRVERKREILRDVTFTVSGEQRLGLGLTVPVTPHPPNGGALSVRSDPGHATFVAAAPCTR